MGRPRLFRIPGEPLPQGLWKHGRKFRAKRPNDREYTYFGTDYVSAVAAYAAWCKAASGNTRTVASLLELCAGEVWPARVAAGKMSHRTLRDYQQDKKVLITGLGGCPLDMLKPSHIAQFRDARQVDAPSHVRNEMACLSSALAYAVERDLIPANPALQVRRPSKQVRDRLIDDSEYLKVYQRALPSLQLAMTLAIRTLALPADVLKLGPRNVKRYDDGTRTLRWSRGKTNVKVEVAIVGELAAALEPFLSNPTLHPTFVRREDGLPYTVDGIGAMFRRACVGYTGRGKRYSPNGDAVPDFGLRDLRAKGATEMYRAGVDIRRIQKLLGHKSVSTTEIYLKRLLAEIVRPNEQPIIALASKPST
jgi:integrase